MRDMRQPMSLTGLTGPDRPADGFATNVCRVLTGTDGISQELFGVRYMGTFGENPSEPVSGGNPSAVQGRVFVNRIGTIAHQNACGRAAREASEYAPRPGCPRGRAGIREHMPGDPAIAPRAASERGRISWRGRTSARAELSGSYQKRLRRCAIPTVQTGQIDHE